jgi:hypothetical protein
VFLVWRRSAHFKASKVGDYMALTINVPSSRDLRSISCHHQGARLRNRVWRWMELSLDSRLTAIIQLDGQQQCWVRVSAIKRRGHQLTFTPVGKNPGSFLDGSAFAGARSMLVTRYSRCTFRKAASHLARSHSTKATSSPISVALHIAKRLSVSTETMNVRVRSLYPKADSRPGTES